MEKKLGLSALTALVLSSMLGAGVFSLPQNMAAVASPSALIIGWGITGVGILLLAFAMLLLTRIRPDLDRLGILAVCGDRQRLLSGDRFLGPQFLYRYA